MLIQRAPLSKTRFYTGESWLHAVTLDDSTPPCRISELRVWSYEPFIVPPSSSSGSTSRQNLEILYIINHMTHNKNGKNMIKILALTHIWKIKTWALDTYKKKHACRTLKKIINCT